MTRRRRESEESAREVTSPDAYTDVSGRDASVDVSRDASMDASGWDVSMDASMESMDAFMDVSGRDVCGAAGCGSRVGWGGGRGVTRAASRWKESLSALATINVTGSKAICGGATWRRGMGGAV